MSITTYPKRTGVVLALTVISMAGIIKATHYYETEEQAKQVGAKFVFKRIELTLQRDDVCEREGLIKAVPYANAKWYRGRVAEQKRPFWILYKEKFLWKDIKPLTLPECLKQFVYRGD